MDDICVELNVIFNMLLVFNHSYMLIIILFFRVYRSVKSRTKNRDSSPQKEQPPQDSTTEVQKEHVDETTSEARKSAAIQKRNEERSRNLRREKSIDIQRKLAQKVRTFFSPFFKFLKHYFKDISVSEIFPRS